MAKVPYVGYPQVQPSFIETPEQRIPSANDPNAFGAQIGTAFQRLGGEFEKMAQVAAKAEAIKQQEMLQLERFNAQKTLNQFNEAENERLMRTSREAPPEAVNFSRDFMTEHDKNRQKAVKSLSPRMQLEYGHRFEGVRGGYSSKSLDFEFKKRDNYYTTEVDKQATISTSGALNDPDSVDARIAANEESIATSGLPAESKIALRDKTNTSIIDASITGLQQQGRIAEARALRDRTYGTVPLPPGAKTPEPPEGTVTGPPKMPNATKSLEWEAKFNSHYKDVQTAADKQAKAEHDALKKETEQEVLERSKEVRSEGKPALTMEYLQSVKHIISNDIFNGGLLVLQPDSTKVTESDPEAVIEQTDAVGALPPHEFIKVNNRLYREKKITNAQYNKGNDTNRTIWSGPDKPFAQGRRNVEQSLAPSVFSNQAANAMGKRSQQRAITEYEAWFSSHEGATTAEVIKEGDAIIQHYSVLSYQQMRTAIGVPRYLRATPRRDIKIEHVDAARQKLFDDMEAVPPRIGNAEAENQINMLADWANLIALEDERRSRGGGTRSPSTPR